jgi:hypothetical protein
MIILTTVSMGRLEETVFVTYGLLRDWLSIKEIGARKRFETAIRELKLTNVTNYFSLPGKKHHFAGSEVGPFSRPLGNPPFLSGFSKSRLKGEEWSCQRKN